MRATPEWEGPWAWYGYAVLGGAAMLLEMGADLHLPWWIMVGTAAAVAAFGGARVRDMLRDDFASLVLTIAAATAGWAMLYGAAWLGENGQEALWRPWRWWVECLLLAAWAAASEREVRAP